MGRTRPLLQQIIMGVKINLAKWSDALLETSNCFSLILLPPPHSLRTANDAVVGADVSLREEGAWGLPPRGFEPIWYPTPPQCRLSWDFHPSQHQPQSSAAPRPRGGLHQGRFEGKTPCPSCSRRKHHHLNLPGSHTAQVAVTGDQHAEHTHHPGSAMSTLYM